MIHFDACRWGRKVFFFPRMNTSPKHRWPSYEFIRLIFPETYEGHLCQNQSNLFDDFFATISEMNVSFLLFFFLC